jgi:pyruvate ferredoxin oxidoreductase alpha subunit
VIVLNRAVAVGSGSILGQDVRLSIPRWTIVHDVVLGLGGRPVTRDVLERLVLDVVAGSVGSHELTFYDLDRERAATELARELVESSTANGGGS